MHEDSPRSGKIITFYSYKGGTGRSMAVANIACLLAELLSNSPQKTLVMDWDLEAPGLDRFFAGKSEQSRNVDRPGIIDYFFNLRQLLNDEKDLYDNLVPDDGWRILDKKLSLDDYIIKDAMPGVDFIKAGRFDSQYPELVSSFDWVEFYNRYGSAIRAFRELLASKYAYCLIDSRTGLTDISGICTMLMPEKLVTVFTPNKQSLYGLFDLLPRAIEYRRMSDDMRPLAVFPLPSRIDGAEQALRLEWRGEYQRGFEKLFCQLYEIEKCNLTGYFDDIQLPHVSYYAYGEKIAVLEEPTSEALSLRRAFEVFFQRLIELDFAWETPVEALVEAPSVIKSKKPADRSMLPPPYPFIRDRLYQGFVIPFLGAGASLGERNPPEARWNKGQANFLPKSTELAEYLAKKTEFPPKEPTDLPKVAQYFHLVGGRQPLHQELHTIFDHDYPLTSLHTFLAEKSEPLLIVTTNYDNLIERAFQLNGRKYDVVIHTTDLNLGDRLLWWPYGNTEPIEVLPKSLDIDLKSVTVIYKMHGTVDHKKPDRDQYVITEDDYIDFLARMIKKTAIPAIFAEPFQTRHFLFMGYSLRDWNLRVVLNRMEKTLRRHKEITSWAIQDTPSPVEKRFWQERGVEVYDVEIEDFVERLKQA